MVVRMKELEQAGPYLVPAEFMFGADFTHSSMSFPFIPRKLTAKRNPNVSTPTVVPPQLPSNPQSQSNAISKGKEKAHVGPAPEECAALFCLALSEYALWSDPDLRMKLSSTEEDQPCQCARNVRSKRVRLTLEQTSHYTICSIMRKYFLLYVLCHRRCLSSTSKLCCLMLLTSGSWSLLHLPGSIRADRVPPPIKQVVMKCD